MEKVMIGIPSNDMIHAHFAMNLVNLVLVSAMNGIQVAITNQQSSIIEIGRCELVKAAKKVNASKILFLDSDMTFRADTLIELLKSEKDIICCDASQRREPYNSVVLKEDGRRIDHRITNEKLVKIKGVSGACLLVDMKVFDKIGDPPFLVEYNKDKKSFLGEDFYFSNAARKNGYDIWCDTELSKSVGHIGCKTFFVKQS